MTHNPAEQLITQDKTTDEWNLTLIICVENCW